MFSVCIDLLNDIISLPTLQNPISAAYAAIWAALNAFPAFNPGLIKPGLGTQINYQTPGTPPTNVQAADRQALKLIEGDIVGLPYQVNSKCVEIQVTFPLQILSGSLLIDKMNLVWTVVYQALIAIDLPAPPGVAGTLGKAGLIYKWTMAKGNGGVKNRDAQAKQPFWVDGLVINVWLRIDNQTYTTNVYT